MQNVLHSTHWSIDKSPAKVIEQIQKVKRQTLWCKTRRISYGQKWTQKIYEIHRDLRTGLSLSEASPFQWSPREMYQEYQDGCVRTEKNDYTKHSVSKNRQGEKNWNISCWNKISSCRTCRARASEVYFIYETLFLCSYSKYSSPKVVGKPFHC